MIDTRFERSPRLRFYTAPSMAIENSPLPIDWNSMMNWSNDCDVDDGSGAGDKDKSDIVVDDDSHDQEINICN